VYIYIYLHTCKKETDTVTPDTLRVIGNMWVMSRSVPLASISYYLPKHQTRFITKCNTCNRRTAYRHMKSCECTVRIVVGCNSYCSYIAVMYCSTVRNVSVVQISSACYWETGYRNFIWFCVSFITHEWPLIHFAIFYCEFLFYK